MKNFDHAKLLSDLLGIDWYSISRSADDINVIGNLWTDAFSFILKKHAPTRNGRVSDNFCPWLTNDFKLMCKAKDRLKKLAIALNQNL